MVITFKPIPNFEKYYANECGIVINSESGNVLTHSINNSGYAHVALYDGGKYHFKSVHRIVAELFIPNPDNYPVINHIDGNKLNNSIDNLEWCTQLHNVTHAALVLGTMNQYQKFHIKASKPLYGVYPDGTKTRVFKNAGEAAKEFNCHKPNIFRAIKNKSTCKGLKWYYQ